MHLNKVLPVLKEKLLAKGAIVICDETWCRVKVAGKYGKKYIWCMVNKDAKIAVYFYDDGSRGREVLRQFLGKNEIDALQSDGFNVYMYLDNELVDVDHLCCLAHARAKFKYAFEQGKDEEAEYFIRNIGRLLGPPHPIPERWPVLYRPLDLWSLATEGTQELTCRTHASPYDSRAQKLADFWQLK